MLLSVVLCTYDPDNYLNLIEAVNSLLNQTYRELEIIIIIDDGERLYKKVTDAYAAQGNIRVFTSRAGTGISEARNTGIREAEGDIIAFMDDDAVADIRWLECLVDTYAKTDAIAVGGKVMPIWLSEKPDYLPEELNWLVGLTYERFAGEGVTEVRNAFGPNMSFRREVFSKVGLFNGAFGFAEKRKIYLQGEEAELALRMQSRLGKRVIYNQEIVVYHKVSAAKARLGALLKRAFYQGYTKAQLKVLNTSPKPLAAEESYLRYLLFNRIPSRLRRVFVVSHRLTEIKQLLVLLASIIAVGLGFAYGHLRRPQG